MVRDRAVRGCGGTPDGDVCSRLYAGVTVQGWGVKKLSAFSYQHSAFS